MRASVRAYAGAIDHDCRSCGAVVGEFCTYVDYRGNPQVRRVPCVSRVEPTAIDVIEDGPPPDVGTVDFGEPRHPRSEV